MKKIRRMQVIFVVLVLMLMVPLATAQASTPVQDARNGVVRIAVVEKKSGEILGYGSGFFIGETGKPVEYIITNAHVAGTAYTYDGSDIYFEEDPNIYCVAVIDTIYNSELTMNCQVVKIFDDVDLAILKLNAPTVTRSALTLKSAEKVGVTDKAYAIGFPGSAETNASAAAVLASSLEYITVTTGSVTRESNTLWNEQYIQIDASINNGNSGGPLVTEDGCVVGVVSCGALDAQNTNYALYIDYAINFLDNSGIAYEKSNGAPVTTPAPQTSTPAPQTTTQVPEAAQTPTEETTATPEEIIASPDSSTGTNQTPTGGSNVLLIVGGIALLALLGGGIFLLVTKKSKPGAGGTITDDPGFPPPSPTESIWACPNCGIRNDARFCAKCGREKPGTAFREQEPEHRFDTNKGFSGSESVVKGGLKTSRDMNYAESEKRSGSGAVADEHFKKPALKSTMGTTAGGKSSSTSTPAPRMKSSLHTETGSGTGRDSAEFAGNPTETKPKLKSSIRPATPTPSDSEAKSYLKRPKNL